MASDIAVNDLRYTLVQRFFHGLWGGPRKEIFAPKETTIIDQVKHIPHTIVLTLPRQMLQLGVSLMTFQVQRLADQ
eukprot:138702-Karenia_brevis.AAC.1